MIPYWLLFLLSAWMAITRLRPVENKSVRWSGSWYMFFCILVLMIGLRHEVGADWEAYLNFYDYVKGYDLSLQESLIAGPDPAYMLLNWLAAKIGGGIYFVNTVCAVLFSWGLIEFCRAQPRPWLALTVSIPYLVIVVAMGYSRQGVAIGLAMLGLVALINRRLLRFTVFIFLAAAFHKSAVILMPLALLSVTKHKLRSILWVTLFTFLLFLLFLQESVEAYKLIYIEAEYQSRGAAIRVAMNSVPAVLFLLLRRRFSMDPIERVFWTRMSLIALAFVMLLKISPSSTAVDRLALYWIPLQLFVLSRLPDAIGKSNFVITLLVNSMVVFYSAAILYVWLNYADHAVYWIPYKFYPFVNL